jgi:pimeloyl-ACP methyl ester carboxylesterase
VTYEFPPRSLQLLEGNHSDKYDNRANILMIPGFCWGDPSLYPLAWRLCGAGYRVFFAGIWCNVGCARETIEYLEQTLGKLYLTNHKKLVIIGHSLGGIYARELARRVPDLTERIVLMGSSIRPVLGAINPLILTWYILSRPRHPEKGSCVQCIERLCGTNQPEPPGVPETVIYSKCDEVVAWRSCIETGPNVECIEVNSSHIMMPYRPEIWNIILDRIRRSPTSLATSSLVANREGTPCLASACDNMAAAGRRPSREAASHAATLRATTMRSSKSRVMPSLIPHHRSSAGKRNMGATAA